MKTFIYCSMLLFTAGAAFGIVDYTKSKKDGTLEKVYKDTPEPEVIPSDKGLITNKQITPVVNDVKANPETEKMGLNPKKNFLKSASAKIKLTQKKAKERITPKAPVPEVMEIVPIPVSEKEIAPPPPPPPPRELNIRDFGRGSLKQRKVKKI